MNIQESKKTLYNATYMLLRPLVRIFLRNGMPFAALAEIAKRAYVDVAEEEFAVPGKKQTNSRIAMITGLTRKEVHRIKALSEDKEQSDGQDLIERYNRAARVVYGWVHNEKYNNEDNQSLDLIFDGSAISFISLVKEFSGDVSPRTILDELLLAGVVEETTENTIRLLERAYIPQSSEIEKLQYLGTDVSGLISTMDRNIHMQEKKPFFQRKVYYDNLPDVATVELQKILADKGQSLLEVLDKWMAEHDRDENPQVEGTGRKASGIGIYYFENDVEDDVVDDVTNTVNINTEEHVEVKGD